MSESAHFDRVEKVPGLCALCVGFMCFFTMCSRSASPYLKKAACAFQPLHSLLTQSSIWKEFRHASGYGCFLKWYSTPIVGWLRKCTCLLWKIFLKWMIWGYPMDWKLPYSCRCSRLLARCHRCWPRCKTHHAHWTHCRVCTMARDGFMLGLPSMKNHGGWGPIQNNREFMEIISFCTLTPHKIDTETRGWRFLQSCLAIEYCI